MLNRGNYLSFIVKPISDWFIKLYVRNSDIILGFETGPFFILRFISKNIIVLTQQIKNTNFKNLENE